MRPWASVGRIPTADGLVWFKACAAVQAFEPQLSADLFARWPDRVGVVIAHDPARRWMLTSDAGLPIREYGNDPAIWLRALPRYAELQRGEVAHAAEHVATGVPDLRTSILPVAYEALIRSPLPLEPIEQERLRAFAPRFERLCAELFEEHPIDSIQHDDLHVRSVFVSGDTLRVLDWGDSSVAEPFFSLVVTFQFLEEHNGLDRSDLWFERLSAAYLEPWGSGFGETLQHALRIGEFARVFAWHRQREAMPAADQPAFDVMYASQLRRALARIDE